VLTWSAILSTSAATHHRCSFPDRAALRDLGSFGSSRRERLLEEEAACCGDANGDREGQAGQCLEVPPGTLIKLRLICASGIHQGSYFQLHGACAVLSTTSSEDVFAHTAGCQGVRHLSCLERSRHV